MYNVQNCLAAASAAIALGISPETVAAGLSSVRGVPGRLERVDVTSAGSRGDGGATVLVDYAHTDDALDNALSALRPLAKGRLVVLFGCGGDRDRTKRSRMARAAARWADRIIVTSDNPRTEDPGRIIDDIMAGFTGEERLRVQIEPDRRRAIASAVATAGPSDIVLLAGKGHEDYQEINGERKPFHDVTVAMEALREMAAVR
jgi:UDP-N-acetylmuramoyl-L-alanyl-D-glutamate--2,6-diaminopimelate ligase